MNTIKLSYEKLKHAVSDEVALLTARDEYAKTLDHLTHYLASWDTICLLLTTVLQADPTLRIVSEEEAYLDVTDAQFGDSYTVKLRIGNYNEVRSEGCLLSERSTIVFSVPAGASCITQYASQERLCRNLQRFYAARSEVHKYCPAYEKKSSISHGFTPVVDFDKKNMLEPAYVHLVVHRYCLQRDHVLTLAWDKYFMKKFIPETKETEK